MRKFSTFEGVFTPTLLSILGVIMYLRLGWVVGQVGLWSALGIVVLANTITLATALSMSSIVTNIRIGTGGAHSIIAKSLGVEAGGAIGIPLYLSQAISVAFYITGFTECWLLVFPAHDQLMISLAVWSGVLIVSYLSARLAFRLQYVIMGVIFLSLVSVFLARPDFAGSVWQTGGMKAVGFWGVFAIFFPAVTGVLAGASMSGELEDPRRSIPVGTLSAIAVSFIVYLILAVWLGRNVPAQELVANTGILIDLARWRWLVIGGVMGATLSSALTMAVGSPRTLLALGKHGIVPFSSSFVRINRKGEPSTAIMFTALLSLLTLLFGTLDSVATLLTMVFLITYGMINLSVFIEQSIGIASFRPSFRIPRVVSFFGGAGCLAVMFLVNVKFCIAAFLLILIAYVLLVRRKMKIYSPDVRSGLLIFLAERLAKAAARLPYHPKIWKPNLIIPLKRLSEASQLLPLVRDIIFPSGRVMVIHALPTDAAGDPQDLPARQERYRGDLSRCVESLKEENLFVETSVVAAPDPTQSLISVIQAVRDMSFPPNTLFYLLPEKQEEDKGLLALAQKTRQEGLGMIFLKYHPERGYGQQKVVNLWIRQQSPNMDLSILIALKLMENWDGQMRIIQAVPADDEAEAARDYGRRLVKLMRLPEEVEVTVLVGSFPQVLAEAPPADINFFGMPEIPDLRLVQTAFDVVQTSVLFLRDSEHESAIA